MRELLWALCGLLAVAGLLCLAWCRLLLPVPGAGVRLEILARDGAPLLEQQVRGLMWLHGLSVLRCPVEIRDGGLDERGCALARQLAARWPESVTYHERRK